MIGAEIVEIFLPDARLDGETLRNAETEPESFLHESCTAATGSVDLMTSIERVGKACEPPAVLAVAAGGGLKLAGGL